MNSRQSLYYSLGTDVHLWRSKGFFKKRSLATLDTLRVPSSSYIEAISTARAILTQTDATLDLLLVGDSASYGLLKAFIDIDPERSRIRAHLVETLETAKPCASMIQLIENSNISYKKYFLDISSEHGQSFLMQIRKDYLNTEIISALHIYMLDKIFDQNKLAYPVISLSPFRFIKRDSQYQVFIPGAQNRPILEYFKQKNIAGIPNFFLRNCSLALSFILSPSALDRLESSEEDSAVTPLSAYDLFQHSGFDIPTSIRKSPMNVPMSYAELVPREKRFLHSRRGFMGVLAAGAMTLLSWRKVSAAAMHSQEDFLIKDQDLIVKSLKLDGVLVAASTYCK